MGRVLLSFFVLCGSPPSHPRGQRLMSDVTGMYDSRHVLEIGLLTGMYLK